MSQRDDPSRHALLASSRARGLLHPRSTDRATVIRELREAIKARHVALSERQATLFAPGLRMDDHINVTWIEGHLVDDPKSKNRIVSQLFILNARNFNGWIRLPWQALAIKLFGRARFVRKACDRVFDDLARTEARLVADQVAQAPAGWASAVDREAVSSAAAAARGPRRSARI